MSIDVEPRTQPTARAATSTIARWSSPCARIAAVAGATPARLAAVDSTGQVTFAELDERADRLASYLVESGVVPNDCLALWMDRSIDFVTAALAVWKAGAAYLPIDPAMPEERAASIIDDAQAALVLTHRGKARNQRSAGCRIVDLEGPERAAIERATSIAPEIPVEASSLAYVIYTSGSTGRPKGVEITHANLDNLIGWHQVAFDVRAEDRASQVAGLGFDAAAWEIWPHLTAGASLHFADETTRRSPQLLRDWLVAREITISFVPTVLAEQMLHLPWPSNTALRTLLTGADTLHRRPPGGLPFALVNNYGPTECTVVATSGGVGVDGPEGLPSIGRPIANTRAFIVDDQLKPLPDGEAGELCLAGASVGRGYRNAPELTASRFVSLTTASGDSTRVYRTGDRVRRLLGGEIAFLGRLDDQIKLRGYRIEPGEIVASLDRHPNIVASAVVVVDDGAGRGAPSDLALVAYCVASQDAGLLADDLRAFLSGTLPDYMIPSRFLRLDAFPLTSNGKIDRSALTSSALGEAIPDSAAPVVEPTSDPGFEPRIAAMVASLLGNPAIDPEENFFMAGGHSMFGVQLVAKIRDTFGVKLTLRQLFNAPTVVSLAALVSKLDAVPALGGP